jgi:PAS domain S-box-containing protein
LDLSTIIVFAFVFWLSMRASTSALIGFDGLHYSLSLLAMRYAAPLAEPDRAQKLQVDTLMTENVCTKLWPTGGSKVGSLVRAYHWSNTPLGPIESWPQSLKTVVDLVLAAPIPMCILWGGKLIQIYNDAYVPLMGRKHPEGLGQAAPACWSEFWDVARPLCDRVFAGDAVHLEWNNWTLRPSDRAKETWFDFYLTPIRNETGAVAGAHVAAFEVTDQVKAKVSRDWVEPVPRRSEAGQSAAADLAGLTSKHVKQGVATLMIGIGSDIVSHRRTQRAFRQSEARLKAAVDLVGLGQYSWDPQTNGLEWDERVKALWGLPPEALIDYDVFRAGIHPDDLARVEEAIANCADPGGDGIYDIEYRVIGADKVERWIATRGQTAFEGGSPVGFLGVALEVTERKRAEAARETLIAELQHRTRNLLALVRSISMQTRAASTTLADYAVEFNDRLAALSRVQGLLSRGDDAPVTLQDLVLMELDALGTRPDSRIVVEGPKFALPKLSVQTLALAVHELATNALKYGALYGPEGRLAVKWRVFAEDRGEPRLALEWRESELDLSNRFSNTAKKGFGRHLIEDALPYQLDATTRFELGKDGVRCQIELPLTARLSAARRVSE